MTTRAAGPREPTPKLHLRYTRLPNQISDLWSELIYRSEKIIVGKSKITSTHRVTFDGKVVLAPGFKIIHFDLSGKWFDIGKIRDLNGKHTGYYCDIATPPRPLQDGGIELTDLFLDLWVSPDLRYKILDEEELKEALHKGWITKQLHDKAKKELKKLTHQVEQKNFPPPVVKQLEKKLKL
jgi:predicted RNA-binding protein associated with RNAse of E/G family